MDEPTHANESFFWDQVADWVLDAYAFARGEPLPPETGEHPNSQA